MELISTRDKNKSHTLQSAMVSGLAPDGGLFMPRHCVPFPSSFYNHIHTLSQLELFQMVAHQLLQKAIPRSDLDEIVADAITFPSPLVKIVDNLWALELFHGPSLAFKDFGAQFMARLLCFFLARQKEDAKLVVLVATSGDTGGAVAAGFANVDGIDVVILYPKGGVSVLQERQLTTFGKNVHAIEVDGTFDDCQALVKTCFSDSSLRRLVRITSANSINIGRLIPQTFYYFDAYRQSADLQTSLTFSVPSGNFGNLTAGLMAKSLGLPVRTFLAATNINDVVPKFLDTGHFRPVKSIRTLSNAMDVGNPSNFERMIHLFEGSTWNVDQRILEGYSFTDQQTVKQIEDTFRNDGYLLDPHGAFAVAAAHQHLAKYPDHHVIALQTAHASKFKSTVEHAIGAPITLHPYLTGLLDKPTYKTALSCNYDELKSYLLQI